MNQHVGIRDIAKFAGVSVATVSRVINTPEKATKKTRDKVNKIINEYNYVPNILVRDIYKQTSNTIAIFTLDIEISFFVELIKELNNIAFTNKYTLIICNTENNPEKEMEYLKFCEGIRTRGIIFTEGYSKEIFSSPAANQNLVFHDRYVSDKYSSVVANNKKGIKMLVDYLYNLGHTKFAFIGENDAISSQQRKQAFLETLKEKDIIVSPEYIIKGDWKARSGVDALDYICTLSDRPTAIVCANDTIARGFILRANKMGLKVPRDFSVVGFDGYTPEYFYPRITTVKQDVKKIAQNLFDCVILPADAESKHIMLDVEMVIGDSCHRIS